MSARTLRLVLSVWAIVLAVLGVGVRSWLSLSQPPAKGTFVQTWWKDGQRIHRAEFGADVSGEAPPRGAIAVDEVILGRGPFYPRSFIGTLMLVTAKDGVEATLGDKHAYATVDDLLSRQAYDHAHGWDEASFGWGTDLSAVYQVLAEQLKVTPEEVRAKAKFERVRFQRRESRWVPVQSQAATMMKRPEPLDADHLTVDIVKDAIKEAAVHLARDTDDKGKVRYLFDAASNHTIPDYNWVRHAGATLFLAQAAAELDDAYLRFASLRAADLLLAERRGACGLNTCIVTDDVKTDLGGSAVAMLAFEEIARTNPDPKYKDAVVSLARFLKSQQRADGEFMHYYDRAKSTPIDEQVPYFTGEATLALARAHTITGAPDDLEAARRGLSHLSGEGWRFFGSRYYFAEEHWTCQAVAELWDRAPSDEALTFCGRWNEYQRRLQLGPHDTPYDADGAFGLGPFVVPRVTPVSSRGEAAGAYVETLYRKNAPASEIAAPEAEFNRALAFVLRSQFHPGPTHLFANPVAARGAVPGSLVDWQIRVDYEQHAGGMFLRWLRVSELKRARGL